MRELTNILWPRPQELSAIEHEKFRQMDLVLDAQIKGLPDVDEKQLAAYLEAVRRIADEEENERLEQKQGGQRLLLLSQP